MNQISSQSSGSGWTPAPDPNDPMNGGGGGGGFNAGVIGQIWDILSGHDAAKAMLPMLEQLLSGGTSYTGSQGDPRIQNLLRVSRSFRYNWAKQHGWSLSETGTQQWVTNGGPVGPNGPVAPTTPSVPSGGAGTGTTTGSPAVVAGALNSGSTVPLPFSASLFNNANYHGFNYGDPLTGAAAGAYSSGWHEGQDYGVPAGTQLTSPFGGTVRTGYNTLGGSYVDLIFNSQGDYLRFYHLGSINVQNGATVQPGQLLALTGNSGSASTGAHLLIEERNGAGQPMDPRPLLNEIFNGTPSGIGNNGKGTTYANLISLGVDQTGMPTPTGQTAQTEVTPDGKVLYAGTPDRQAYDLLNTVYEKLYGTPAPFSMVAAVHAAGVTNASQMAALAANWPSDIPGVSFGVRDNIYNVANGIAMKEWGRPIPDSLVKQLAASGVTDTNGIKTWFDDHLPSDMPATDYQQIYDAVNPQMQGTYNEGPSPAYIGYLWGQNQDPSALSTGTVSASGSGRSQDK